MERIFLPRIIGAVVLCFACSLCFGQRNYYVFKKQGEPVLNTSKILVRGSLFSEADTLYMGTKDYVLLVNELGELFEITQPNKYVYSAIEDFRRRLADDSFTKKYFMYVWKQFTNQTKKKQEAGVVYREERKVKLLSPRDSVKYFSPEVRFTWENTTDQEEVFFFLKDLKTEHLTKIGVTGSTLVLHLDNFLLRPDQTYEWSVSTNAFPNLTELKFNLLEILTKQEYENLKEEVAALIKAFKLLGFSEAEIQEAICIDYKFCSSQ